MTDDNNPITPEIVEDENEKKEGQLVQQNVKPDILYLIPITGRPHLPAQVQPLMVSKKRWEGTLTKASKDSKNLLGLAYLREVKEILDTLVSIEGIVPKEVRQLKKTVSSLLAKYEAIVGKSEEAA